MFTLVYISTLGKLTPHRQSLVTTALMGLVMGMSIGLSKSAHPHFLLNVANIVLFYALLHGKSILAAQVAALPELAPARVHLIVAIERASREYVSTLDPDLAILERAASTDGGTATDDPVQAEKLWLSRLTRPAGILAMTKENVQTTLANSISALRKQVLPGWNATVQAYLLAAVPAAMLAFYFG